jgi:hypothetical protein
MKKAKINLEQFRTPVVPAAKLNYFLSCWAPWMSVGLMGIRLCPKPLSLFNSVRFKIDGKHALNTWLFCNEIDLPAAVAHMQCYHAETRENFITVKSVIRCN